MSTKDPNLYNDDVLKDLDALKAKYADYGVDDDALETINKNIVRSNPDYNAFEADFAGGFGEYEKDEPYRAAPTPKPVSNPISEPESEPVSAQEPEPIAITPAGTENNSEYDYIGKSIGHKRAVQKYAEAEISEQYEEPKEERRSKKKKKKKSHKLLTTFLIIFILAIIWGVFFSIDYMRVSNWQNPIFCIMTDEYENGGKDFLGAFYKFQFHVNDDGSTEADVLPWFQEGKNVYLPRKNDKKSSVSETDNASEEKDDTIVEISIPQEFYLEEISSNIQLTEEQKQLGYKSVALSEDGTAVVYQIGKSDYDKEVARIKADTEAKLYSLADGTDYPSIKKVEFTDDFKEITLYFDKTAYTKLDSFVKNSVNEWVGYYQSFSNKYIAPTVTFKDIADNSIIE